MPVLEHLLAYLYKVSRPSTDDDTMLTSVAGIDKTITRKMH